MLAKPCDRACAPLYVAEMHHWAEEGPMITKLLIALGLMDEPKLRDEMLEPGPFPGPTGPPPGF